MNTRHTPGPWHSASKRVNLYLQAHSCEALGFCIGFVNTDQEWIREQAEANARLIAYAPEMLDALIDAREALRRAGAIGELAVAESAIAKVTGVPHA